MYVTFNLIKIIFSSHLSYIFKNFSSVKTLSLVDISVSQCLSVRNWPFLELSVKDDVE